MNVEYRKIDTLQPHPKNYRKHPQRQLELLADSLRIHGIQKPVVITRDGLILAGHGTVCAARMVGMTEIPCHIYDGDNPEAFLVMDNRSNEFAEDDEGMLTDILYELGTTGDLSAAGYTDDGLTELLSQQLIDVDAEKKQPANKQRDGFKLAEILNDTAVLDLLSHPQPGQFWQLGRHILYTGDAREGDIMQRFCTMTGGECPALAWCDLPYETVAETEWPHYLSVALPYSRCAVVSLPHDTIDFPVSALYANGFTYQQDFVWCYPKSYKFEGLATPVQHQRFVLGIREEVEPKPALPTTVFKFAIPAITRYYPTTQCTHLVQAFINACTTEGEIVYDPYAGYGTTVFACEETGRTCWAVENDMFRCTIAIALWESETGEQAVLLE